MLKPVELSLLQICLGISSVLNGAVMLDKRRLPQSLVQRVCCASMTLFLSMALVCNPCAISVMLLSAAMPAATHQPPRDTPQHPPPLRHQPHDPAKLHQRLEHSGNSSAALHMDPY